MNRRRLQGIGGGTPSAEAEQLLVEGCRRQTLRQQVAPQRHPQTGRPAEPYIPPDPVGHRRTQPCAGQQAIAVVARHMQVDTGGLRILRQLLRRVSVEMADRVEEVDNPGLTSPNLANFDWTRLPRPVYPLDEDATWSPAPSA